MGFICLVYKLDCDHSMGASSLNVVHCFEQQFSYISLGTARTSWITYQFDGSDWRLIINTPFILHDSYDLLLSLVASLLVVI